MDKKTTLDAAAIVSALTGMILWEAALLAEKEGMEREGLFWEEYL